MAAPKKQLEKIPGHSVGVRENAAARMVKLGRPICPNSKMKMIWSDTERRWVADDNQLPNCQKEGGQWWIACAERGHDPYFSTRTWYEKVDKIDVTIDPDTGQELEEVVGQRRIRHTEKRPNIAQVALHVRVNSGQGAKFKMEKHGFVRLADLGFEEVCQFRNCQKPLDPKLTNTVYGSYCSAIHMQLIAADSNSIMLHYPEPSVNGEEYQKILRARRRQLREAALDV